MHTQTQWLVVFLTFSTLTVGPVWAEDSSDMNHGDMEMQGGSKPEDARDPNAYSDGYTRGHLHMGDQHNFGALLVDRLEQVDADHANFTAYDAQAWFGQNYERFVVKAEGEVDGGKWQEASTELLWSHAIATFWDRQLGVRQDSGDGPNRSWLAFGVQGLAPYWFEVDATAYAGEGGRTALTLTVEYELLFTQKLILQPRVEANLYGKSDVALNVGSGLADATAGVRLRYEFTRQFAPYVGVEQAGKFGETADFVRAAGDETNDTRWVAGVRFWF